jgi:hypothetical protein
VTAISVSLVLRVTVAVRMRATGSRLKTGPF